MKKHMNELLAKLKEDITSVDTYAPAVTVEYDPFDLALSDAKMTSKRLCEYMAAQTVAGLDWQSLFGQIRFDGSVPADLFHRTGHKHFWEAASNFYIKPIDNLYLFEWQHSTPNYERIIERGISGCLADIETSKCFHRNEAEKLDFLEAMEEVCHGIIAWAHRCADACREAAKTADDTRRSELEEAAERLYRVPEFGARTFAEALQTVYICFDMLPDSIGTIDRFLYPYYKKDIAEGNLTREQASDLLRELFLRLQCHTSTDNPNRTKGGECHFAIGGYTEDGEDGFNELSRLIVETLMSMPTHIPEISLRWTSKTPHDILRFMLDCERNDPYKRIAFVNDEPRIKGFMENLGISYHDAIRYTMVGCNEPAFQGTVWFGGETVNIARSLTNTLYRHTEKAVSCKTFEEFFKLYRQSLENDIEEIITAENKFNAMRAKDNNVLSSIFLDGCIENGLSATRGGCRMKLGGFSAMGLTCLIDSLSVIKQFVYDEKFCTMNELIEDLKSNWEKDPDLRTRIYKTGKFFGNGYELSDRMAVLVTDTLHELTENRQLANGEHILIGTLTGYHPHFATFGALTPATPDGRYDGEAFMVGVGQSCGRDREGLTALFSSVAQMQPSGILCGPYLLNVLLDDKLIRDDKYFDRTVDEIETFFRMGGMHIQLNYVSKEELLAARQLPEKYRTMKVRVSGFSGIFVDLDERIQNNIIERTMKKS